MILVHYSTELCELEFQNFNSLLEKEILVIMTPTKVGKQFVPYGDLIGHHVPAIGFVQH